MDKFLLAEAYGDLISDLDYKFKILNVKSDGLSSAETLEKFTEDKKLYDFCEYYLFNPYV